MKILPNDILASRILVVDDQAVNLQLLTQMLRETGYTDVQACQQPREVCGLHARNRYDLILLDLQMPEMDGFAVMEGLKALGIDAYLPVLVLTAQPSQKLQALQAGAKDFVSKPFDFVEVKTRIHNMLEVRLLYRRLEAYSEDLERTVRERTDELLASEARYRSLTELASDWYWEQDEMGNLIQGSGPAVEIFGIPGTGQQDADATISPGGWNAEERDSLQATIAARRPFLDQDFSRLNADGTRQCYRVSGEPMFDRSSRYIGYRGIGAEVVGKQ